MSDPEADSEPSTPSVPEPKASFLRRGPVRRFLELFALSGIVIAQPTFDLLQSNASLFIAWRTTAVELFLFAVITIFVPPLILWGIEWLAGLLSRSAARILHFVFVGVLLLLLAMEVVKKVTDLGPAAIVSVAIGAAAVAIFLFARFDGVRTWVRYLAVAPVVFALLFVGLSPATQVTFNSSPAPADVDVKTPTRIVMVTLDELPTTSLLDGNGNVDADLYPNFAKLAAGSTWYRNDTTVAPFTDAAVPAILTGKFPKSEKAIPHVSEYPDNLFTLLGGSYKMNVHETVSRLCGDNICTSRARRIDKNHGLGGMIEDAGTIWREFASPSRTASFTLDPIHGVDAAALATGGDFLESLQPSAPGKAAKPRLDYLHILLPHFPWHYFGSGQDYSALPGHTLALEDQEWATSWAGTMARQRSLVQTQAADAFLGLIFDRLREIDAYDESLIVVTADHGASFVADEPFRGVAEPTYPEIMWTPLFIKLPGQTKGQVDDRPARSIDIVPTIADVIDVDIPWSVDGRTLLGAVPPEEPRRLLDWERNAVHPADGNYLTFDGAKGFAAVLKGRATDATGDPALRLFQVGPYGSLVGRSSKELISTPAGVDGALRGEPWFGRIDPKAPKVPWADVHGTTQLPSRSPVAITVNGVVAGVYETWSRSGSTPTEFWGLFPPHLFRNGANDVRLYAIEGPPPDPVLHELKIR